MTYSIFQESLFEGSTSSQGVPLVNPSAKQENDKVQTMNGISFPSFYEWWQKQDHVGLSLRMFTDSLISSLDKYSRRITHHWKVKVTPFKRYVFQLQPSTPRTDATDFGSLLPTPTTQEVEHPEAALTPSGRRLAENGNSHSLNLADTLLLTPTASENVQDIDKFKARMEKYPNGTTMPNLATQRSALLPTPDANMGNRGEMADWRPIHPSGHTASLTLNDAVTHLRTRSTPLGFLGTPKAQDSRAALTDRGKSNMGEQVQQALDGANTGLRLQPAFVEYLMGYPIGYTSLDKE